MKQLRVSAIKSGTVIDHIPPERVFQIAQVLDIPTHSHETLIANNLKSAKLHKKAIIKLSNSYLSQVMIDKIALLAEGATIVTIKNYEVAAKQTVIIPDRISGIVSCFNPNCITNSERCVTKFTVLVRSPLALQCYYCEKTMSGSEIAFRDDYSANS